MEFIIITLDWPKREGKSHSLKKKIVQWRHRRVTLAVHIKLVLSITSLKLHDLTHDITEMKLIFYPVVHKENAFLVERAKV